MKNIKITNRDWWLIAVIGVFIIFATIIVSYNFTFSDDILKLSKNNRLTSELEGKLLEEPIRINTATKEELDKLPGIGEYLAQNILDYIRYNGEFQSFEEIMNVDGIGEKKFETILPYIVLE